MLIKIKQRFHEFNSHRELNKYKRIIKDSCGTTPTIDDLIEIVFEKYIRFFNIKQVKSEFRQLCELILAKKPNVILEIGTASGGSLFLISKLASEEAQIISIDLEHGQFGGGYPAYRKQFYESFADRKQTIHLIQGNSHSEEVHSKLEAILEGQKIDVLFIDGDHTYAGAKKDYEYYSRLLSPDGIIAFHDIAIHNPNSKCKVHVLWEELKKIYPNTKEFIENKNQKWAGIGVLLPESQND